MARTIDQIQAELNAAYQPQADIVNQQIAALPQYYGEQQQALDVARQNAYRDILGGASARGMAYSGMPIAEQTRYMGTKYLPALAGLAQQQSQQRASLQSALNDIYSQRLQRAQAIQQQELDREQQQRQFEQQLAMTRSMYGGGGGGYSGGGSSGGGGSSAPTTASGWQGLVNQLKNSGLSWGDAVNAVYKQYGLREGDIASGSIADQAFRNAYLQPQKQSGGGLSGWVSNLVKGSWK